MAVSVEDVSQVSVLDEQGIVLVLADKVFLFLPSLLSILTQIRSLLKSLFWCRQEDLVKGLRNFQRSVDDSMTVNFYRTGYLGTHCFLVVSAWKKGVSLSLYTM